METSASLPERKIEKKFQYSFPDFSSPMLFLTFDRLNFGEPVCKRKKGQRKEVKREGDYSKEAA